MALIIEDVKSSVFFETIIDSGGTHSYKLKGNIIINIVGGPRETIIIPVKDVYEDFPAESVITWLSQIGFTDLIPILVPDHPMADVIRRLPPRNF